MGRNAEVDAWFERCANPMKPVVDRIRAIVLAADRRIEECIKWQAPTFTYRGNLASFFPKSQAAREPHVPRRSAHSRQSSTPRRDGRYESRSPDLERLSPSPVHTLNRAVALAEWRGPADALARLDGLTPPTWLTGSYMWAAVLADLHRRSGHESEAERHRHVALETAPTNAIRELLQRRLSQTP